MAIYTYHKLDVPHDDLGLDAFWSRTARQSEQEARISNEDKRSLQAYFYFRWNPLQVYTVRGHSHCRQKLSCLNIAHSAEWVQIVGPGLEQLGKK